MTYKFSYETILYVYKEDNGKWECTELHDYRSDTSSNLNVDASSDFDSYLYGFSISDIFEENKIKLEEGYFHYWGILETNWFTSYGIDGDESDAETYALEEIIFKLSPIQISYYGLDKDDDIDKSKH